jgi:outer membrane protein assembly factor BamB
MQIKRTLCLSLILITAGIASAQTAAPCGGAQRTLSISWYQFNFDPCLTGNNPYETKLSTATVANLALDWSARTSGLLSPPAVVNGVVYNYNDAGTVDARNAGNGALLWQHPVASSSFLSYTASPAVANGIVYVGDGAGVLWALKAADGTLVWKYQTNSQFSFAATVLNGVVYVTEQNGNPAFTYALDAATGTLSWKYASGTNQNSGGVQPATDGIRVYVAANFQVTAIDAKTGTKIWVSSNIGIPSSSPIVNSGRVYVADKLSELVVLNAATGAVLWSNRNAEDASNIAVANGTVFAQAASWVTAFDAFSGNLLWQIQSNHGYGGLAVANGIVYTGSTNDFSLGIPVALDASSGAMLWSYQTFGGGFTSGPAIVNGMAYYAEDVGAGGGDLWVFHLPNQ